MWVWSNKKTLQDFFSLPKSSILRSHLWDFAILIFSLPRQPVRVIFCEQAWFRRTPFALFLPHWPTNFFKRWNWQKKKKKKTWCCKRVPLWEALFNRGNFLDAKDEERERERERETFQTLRSQDSLRRPHSHARITSLQKGTAGRPRTLEIILLRNSPPLSLSLYCLARHFHSREGGRANFFKCCAAGSNENDKETGNLLEPMRVY